MASKKFSLSRKLRIRKGVGRGIREDYAAFLTAKELKVTSGLQQKQSGSRFKASQKNTFPQDLYFHRGGGGNRPEVRFQERLKNIIDVTPLVAIKHRNLEATSSSGSNQTSYQLWKQGADTKLEELRQSLI